MHNGASGEGDGVHNGASGEGDGINNGASGEVMVYIMVLCCPVCRGWGEIVAPLLLCEILQRVVVL